MPPKYITPHGYNIKKRAFDKEKVVLVLDPGLLLREPKVISDLKDCDVYLTLQGLKWLGDLQEELGEKGRKARYIIRIIDALKGEGSLSKGVTVNREGGKFYVVSPTQKLGALAEPFSKTAVDLATFELMKNLKSALKKEPVLLSVSSETRVLCHLSGFYSSPYPISFTKSTPLARTADGTAGAVLRGKLTMKARETLISKGRIPLDELQLQIPVTQLSANQYVFIEDQEKRTRSLPTRYNIDTDLLELRTLPESRRLFGLEPRNLEQKCFADILSDKNIQIVFVTGKPGTGKTLLSLAAALQQVLKKDKDYERISLIYRNEMPAFEFTDARKEQALMPVVDSFDCILMNAPPKIKTAIGSKSGKQFAQNLLEKGILTIENVEFLRGRTFLRRFIIIDEAQNLSPSEARLILTRAGEGTKFVFCGDYHQAENIDNPEVNEETNGLRYLVDSCRYDSFAAHIDLKKCERSHLVDVLSLILT